MQQLITKAWYSECIARIGKNKERMIKKEVRLLVEDYQNHKKNHIRMHNDFAKLENCCSNLEQKNDAINAELKREKEHKEKGAILNASHRETANVDIVKRTCDCTCDLIGETVICFFSYCLCFFMCIIICRSEQMQ